MHGDDPRAEARRVLGICNACGYCNGLCDLFDAARRRPALHDTDLAHLANLCHGCRSCLYACQYAPPHAFAVNVPRVLAQTRQQSWLAYAWPRAWSGLLARGPLAVGLIVAAAMGLMVATVLVAVSPDVLFAEQRGAGAFYRIVPWWVMMLIGVLPLGWSALALGMGLRRYWCATAGAAPVPARVLWSAVHDVLILRNLGGGGPGCHDLDERPSQRRRWLHQGMLLGLLLSFAATVAATLYHHVWGWEAPYPLLSLPVVLGTLGGIVLSVTATGLLWLKWRGDLAPTAPEAQAADYAFLILLILVAVSGLALLLWRATPAMGLLLALHLGSVLAFFLLLPYSKFVHAGYRFAALLVDASERHRPGK